MATDEDDLISDGKLFHKNTILLKYEFRKREVLHRFGRRSPINDLVAKQTKWRKGILNKDVK